jgi:hypothetical protein
MQIKEVVAHGVHHRATRALTAAHLCLSHKTDLREMVPGFLMADEIPDDVDIRQLIVEFCDHAEAITAIVDMGHVIKDAPL